MLKQNIFLGRLTLCAQLVTALIAPGYVIAADAQQPSSASTIAPTAELPDYFYVPIWGLRVGGTAFKRAPANDTWEYFRAGRGILKVSPSTIEYGTHEVAEALLEDVVTLQNVGASPVTLGTVTAPHQYVASSECNGAVLPPMGTCLFTLRLAPVDVMSANGYVQIPFAADGQTAIANITVSAKIVKPAAGGPSVGIGTGVPGYPGTTEPAPGDAPLVPDYPYPPPEGGLVVNPEDKELELWFPPPIYLGDSPHTRSFPLTASGQKPLSVRSLAVTEGNYFYNPSHDCPPTLQIGQTCTVTVQLNPLAVGRLTGKLQVVTDSYDATTVNVRLLADVDEWVRRITHDSFVDFGVVDRGYSKTKTVTVTNAGNLAVSGIKATAPTPFSVQSTTCNTTLQPGTSCTVTFSVISSSDGDFTKIASITATDLMHAPIPVELQAKVALRSGTFSPVSFSFGLRDMAKLSAALPLNFTNTGTIAVRPSFGPLLDPSPTSAAYGTPFKLLNGSNFAYLNPANCDALIPVGGSCTAYVAVQPTIASAQSLNFTAYPDVGTTARSTNIGISTTGTKQSYVYNPTLMDLGVVDGLQTVVGTIDITNTSLDATSLTGFLSAITQPSNGRGTIALTGTTCSSTLSAGQKTCQIKVVLTGTSLAKDEVQESKDGYIQFIYTGADAAWTKVPVNFLLRGTAPVLTNDGLDFGDIPVGLQPAAAPRRLITVTNPGPSTMALSSVGFPGTASYGLSLAWDTKYPNSCSSNQPIAAGASCVIAVYPTSSAISEWGPQTNTVQLYTIVNGVTSALGAPIPAKANHLEPKLEIQDIKVDGGEQTAASFSAPFKLVYEGTVLIGSNLAAGNASTDLSVSTTNCPNAYITKDSVCSLTFTANAKKGSADRVLRAPIYINKAGKLHELGAITATLTQMAAALSITPPEWDFGDRPALLNTADSALNVKTFVVRNYSPRGTVRGMSLATDTRWVARNSGNRVVDGESLTDCSSVLDANSKCALTVVLSPQYGDTSLLGPLKNDMVLSTSNELGKVTIPVTTNLLPGKLEVTASPEPYVDVPAATTSNEQRLRLKNTGEGVVRWGAVPGKSWFLNIDNLNNQPAFRFVTGVLWGNTSYQPIRGSVLKSATSSADLECNAYVGLQPGAECSERITMSPTGPSVPFKGTLRVGGFEPTPLTTEIALNGNSVAAEIYYSTSTFPFPEDMLVSTEYKSQVVIGNGGNYPLNISGITLNSSYPKEELSLSHNCPTSLPAGEECVMELSLTPDRNRNWGSAYSPAPWVSLSQTTQGVSRSNSLYMTGVSTGSFVTTTPRVSTPDLYLEKENYPSKFLYDVTMTASGPAPVRILGATPVHQNNTFLTNEGTCTVGLVLQPGDTCVFSVSTGTQLTNLTASPFNLTFVPLSINGTHKSETATTVSDRAVTLTAKGTTYPTQAGAYIWPRTVTADRDSKFWVVTPNLMTGTTYSWEGNSSTASQPLSISHFAGGTTYSTKITEGLFRATGTAGVRGVTVKGPPVSQEWLRTASAKKFKLELPGEGTSTVYSTARTYPLTLGGNNLVTIGLKDGGAVSLINEGGGLAAVRYDEYGLPIASYSLGSFSGTRYSGVSATMGADGNLYFSFGTNHVYNGRTCDWWYDGSCRSYTYYTIYYVYRVRATVTLSSTGIASGSVANEAIWSSSSNGAMSPMSTINQGPKDYLSWFWTYTGTYQYYLYGSINGTTYNRTITSYLTGTPSGMAIIGDHAYIRKGDSIYVFHKSGSAPVRYDFPGAGLSTSEDSTMVYNARANLLTLPCYQSKALCSIPARNGALGTLSLEIGSQTEAGNEDGDASTAKLSIASDRLMSLSTDGSIVGFNSGESPSQPRAVRLSTIPVYGGVGAQNHQFTITLDGDGNALPHEIKLKNQGALPMSVTGLSVPAIQHTTDCLNVPYAGTCTVTVQVPHTLWTVASSGNFNINTTIGVDVLATWTRPAQP